MKKKKGKDQEVREKTEAPALAEVSFKVIPSIIKVDGAIAVQYMNTWMKLFNFLQLQRRQFVHLLKTSLPNNLKI